MAALPASFMLTITHVFTTTQQNQRSFQGTFTDVSATCGNSPYNTASIYDINNGTVDQNGNIQLLSPELIETAIRKPLRIRVPHRAAGVGRVVSLPVMALKVVGMQSSKYRSSNR